MLSTADPDNFHLSQRLLMLQGNFTWELKVYNQPAALAHFPQHMQTPQQVMDLLRAVRELYICPAIPRRDKYECFTSCLRDNTFYTGGKVGSTAQVRAKVQTTTFRSWSTDPIEWTIRPVRC